MGNLFRKLEQDCPEIGSDIRRGLEDAKLSAK